MRKVSRTLSRGLLVVLVAGLPAAGVQARPAEDRSHETGALLRSLHVLLSDLGLDRLWQASEITPDLDPNGRKAVLRTPPREPDRALDGTPEPRKHRERVPWVRSSR